jgi:hypothetical protein
MNADYYDHLADLREYQDARSVARDAAYDQGKDDFVQYADREESLRERGFTGQLAIDYRDGWDDAGLQS